MLTYLERKHLFLVSFLALFVELTLIRWLPANVFSLAYFTNIVIIASFLGLGLGALLYKRFRETFQWFPFILLGFVVIILFLKNSEFILSQPKGEFLWTYYYDNKLSHFSFFNIGFFSALTIVFSSVVALMIPIGQKIAKEMGAFNSLQAYQIDLLGSLTGIGVFMVLNFLGMGFPIMWFLIISIVSSLLLLKGKKKYILALLIVSFCLVLGLVYFGDKDNVWSPYYSIQTAPAEDQPGQLNVFVNRFFHQQVDDFFQHAYYKNKFSFPYYFKKPDDLLVLGAGTGNDVAIAKAMGVKNVDAVEIDPVIADIGKKENVHHPYQDSSVHLIIDDGRSYLQRSQKKYDMIILGTLDSHALISGLSTVRLENYLYTKESVEAMKAHLNGNGVLVMLFSSPSDEVKNHLKQLFDTVFQDIPHAAYQSNDNALFNLFFIGGPGLDSTMLLDSLHNNNDPSIVFSKIPQESIISPLITDDWPYVYIFKRQIPNYYLKALLILVLLSSAAILFLLRKKEIFTLSSLNFFVLGAGFMLLEVKNITSLSLLFGSTWIVNTFVFAAILSLLYLANLLVTKVEIEKIWVVYLMLFGALLVNYLMPVHLFSPLGFWVGGIIASLFFALPFFFSSLIFSYYFKMVAPEYIGTMYGVNLAGVVLGGFFEYGSMIFGLKALYILAGIFYLISLLLEYKKQLFPL